MMSGETSIEQVANLLDFFRQELMKAFEEVGVETSEETEAYLVHLLDGYTKLDADKADEVGFRKPAAKLLEEAMHSGGEKRIELYRRLGDASLYSCGFFTAHLTRRSISASYYRRIGRAAYHHLGQMMDFKQPGGIFQVVYKELAVKFDVIVDAFRCVGEQSCESSPAETLDRWATGHVTDMRELLAAGYLPVMKKGT